MQVFITANSPGELAGRVYPVVKELKRRERSIFITLVITPCQYASGMEAAVGEKWPEIDEVVKPGQYLKYILLGYRSFTFRKDKPGVVVFLGGDPLHALLLSRRMKIPAVAYLSKARWKRFFRKFMVVSAEEERKFKERGVEPSKIIRVGDLSLDSLEVTSLKRKAFDDLDFSQPLILFLPGSRAVEVEYMIPFYLRIAPLIRRNFPGVKFIMAISPFISQRVLGKFLPPHSEVQVVRDLPCQVMSICHLAITIPGTNNMQLACLGVPMVVILPLNRAELIPLDGIAGLISPRIPPVGFIKRKILLQLNRKIRFVALPNIRAGKEIVPEIRGIIKPEEVAEKAVELLSHPDKLKKMSGELRELTEEREAKDRVVDVILEILAESEK